MAHGGEELALGAARRLGPALGLAQRLLIALVQGDVLHRGDHRPGAPARVAAGDHAVRRDVLVRSVGHAEAVLDEDGPPVHEVGEGLADDVPILGRGGVEVGADLGGGAARQAEDVAQLVAPHELVGVEIEGAAAELGDGLRRLEEHLALLQPPLGVALRGHVLEDLHHVADLAGLVEQRHEALVDDHRGPCAERAAHVAAHQRRARPLHADLGLGEIDGHGLADELLHAPAEHALGGESVHAGRRLVPQHDAPIGARVPGDDGRRDVVDDAAQEGLRLLDAGARLGQHAGVPRVELLGHRLGGVRLEAPLGVVPLVGRVDHRREGLDVQGPVGPGGAAYLAFEQTVQARASPCVLTPRGRTPSEPGPPAARGRCW